MAFIAVISLCIDDEIGGGAGMKFLSQDKERLKQLNIGSLWRVISLHANSHRGLVLDEGLASPNNKFKFFYGERVPWCTCLLLQIARYRSFVAHRTVGIKVTAKGPTGHGSQFIPNTAVSKLVTLSFV